MSEVSRRTITRTAAWSVPAITVAATAPAFAASSGDPIAGIVEASKCPGKSTKEPDTVIITFRSNQQLPETFAVVFLTVNGVTVPVERVKVEGNFVHVVTIPRDNSADASGWLVIEYMIGRQTYRGEFAYSGSRPNHELCKRI